jgi:alpha-1,2-mannosyltransferase
VAKLPFIYRPFAALLFAPWSGASFATWQVRLAVLTIGLLPVVVYLSPGFAGRPAGLARAAAALTIAALGLWLELVAMTLFFGQINLVLLAVVGDLALPDRIKGKGIGIGLAAGIKLTPLILIPYLLFTRRVKAAAVSALTFAVTVGLGLALLPHASAVYGGGKFTRPGSKPFHLDNQSLNGVVLRFTHAGPRWWWACLAGGPCLLATMAAMTLRPSCCRTGYYYVFTLLVFIAATAGALVLTRRLRPERAQSAPEPDAVWAARPPGVAQ